MKRITFYNEKRGVGKTNLSLLIPMIIKKKHHIESVIIDTVGELFQMRKKEENKLKDIPIWKDRIKESIEICNVSSWDGYLDIESNFDNDKELIVFDVQGIGNDQFPFLVNSDYIFLISDLSSEEDFHIDKELYNTFQSIRYSCVPLEKTYMLFNKVNPDKEVEFEDIDVVLPKLGNKESYKRENISTLSFSIKGDINTLATEVYKLVMLNEQQYYE